MKRRSRVAAVASALALVACGCASHSDSVLTAGYQKLEGHRASPDAATAAATARRAERTWRRELVKRARERPGQVFDNVSAAKLRQRVRFAAREYHFAVVSVELLRPRQLAPRIVVRTDHYLGLAHSTPAILKRLDPRRQAGSDARGWRFEGFYFEARDEQNVPFLIAFNFWRGPSAGGGQWARSEPLYPFAHG